MARVVSPMAVPLSVDISYHNSKNELNKRASDYEVATTAVKVDMPYHSYLNHPFTHPKELEHRQQKQTSGNKYSSYTNSSKSIRLITIPSKKMAGIMNEDLSLNSPTSPLVSPPPPYLHSSAPEQHGDSKAYGLDTKKQQPSVQWPSMMKLSDATGTTTAAVTRPKMAKVLPPQAIPIQYDELPTAASPGPRRASRLFDGNQSSMFNVHVPQDALAQEISAATSLVESFSTSRMTPETFPSFWQETRQSKFLWVFLPFGCATLGSVAWVLTMQVFMELAIVMPVVALALLSLQFGRYRWRRGRFLKKQKNKSHHSATVSDDKIVSAFPHYDEHGAYLAPHQPQQQGPSPSRQQRHHVTFQEPASPQPRFNQQSYKQPRISNAAQGNKQGPHRQQQPQQQQQQQPQSQPQPQPQPQQPRMPLTVNPGLYRANLNNHTGVNNGSPHYQNPQFLSPVDSPQTPPPAYFLKRVELPEIDPIVGEFEVDFSCIQY